MGDFDPVKVVFNAIWEAFQRITITLFGVFFGSLIGLLSLHMESNIGGQAVINFSDLPIGRELISSLSSLLHTKAAGLLVLTLVLIGGGGFFLFRNGWSSSLAILSVVTGGALSVVTLWVLEGFKLTIFLWVTQALILFIVYVLIRLINQLVDKRWRKQIHNIQDQNKARLAAKQKQQADFIKEMEKNG